LKHKLKDIGLGGKSSFLYIVPLKQGLKLNYFDYLVMKFIVFLYIVPLKQGLKRQVENPLGDDEDEFLYIVPLKQGLKRNQIS